MHLLSQLACHSINAPLKMTCQSRYGHGCWQGSLGGATIGVSASSSAESEELLLQNSLHRVEGVRLREWDDALTVGELNEKYRRAEWLRQAEEEAITLHHEQRSRGTVPSYGQALAMATLMEQMHLEVRVPHREHFYSQAWTMLTLMEQTHLEVGRPCSGSPCSGSPCRQPFVRFSQAGKCSEI